MNVEKFSKERRIWVRSGNMKSIHIFKINDEVCFSKLPKEFESEDGKSLYNLYTLNNGAITNQFIIDKSIMDDLSNDLYNVRNFTKIKVENNFFSESIKEEPTKEKDNKELSEKLITLAKKVERKYGGKPNLIANAEKITDYLTRFSEALMLIDGSEKTNKNLYIKSEKDVISFLKEELPDLIFKNNFHKSKEPFSFLDKLETKTLKSAMSTKFWVEDKDLEMIAVSLSDAVDIIKIGVSFSNCEFVKGCEGISHLDTAIRDYFEDDLYAWKNSFQKLYFVDVNLGYEYEKNMKEKIILKDDLEQYLSKSQNSFENLVDKKNKKI
ncbi:hypothetical protein GW796_06580 [archaeon]|nr:hypothetical protein [archaeon]